MEWISVKDRIPKTNRAVVIKMKGAIPCVGAYHHGKERWEFIGQRRCEPCRSEVTHWQELMADPKEVE